MSYTYTIKYLLENGGKEKIEKAVKEAELKTAGEIVVQIVKESRGFLGRAVGSISDKEAVEKRAEREFMNLGIQQTTGRTGVLILVSLKERRVSIKADKDINDQVSEGTWDKPADIVVDGFKMGAPISGICNAVELVGNLLAERFPRKADDKNELSDEVRIG